MKLYHYTTFTNFCSIWIQQKLKFSEWTNCNDVYEREKTYKFTQLSLEYNGKRYPPGVLRQFSSNVFKEVEQYHQLSFCLDYKDIKGYASPMMWGHYARDYQRSGVCIEIESTKVRPIPKGAKIYEGKVDYNSILAPIHFCGVDAEKTDSAQIFVIKNRMQLFFQKHPHWEAENEYRFVSKDCKELDLSEAITSVYVLEEDDITMQSIKHIVMDTKKISYLNVGGLDSRQLNPMTLYDKEELQKEMKYINDNHINIWSTE
ncbi:MAG: DUF2971 domain-containing protein [Prevotella sp.]|nr:DUF2971 domain-containing protein [Prevotella sp.]